MKYYKIVDSQHDDNYIIIKEYDEDNYIVIYESYESDDYDEPQLYGKDTVEEFFETIEISEEELFLEML